MPTKTIQALLNDIRLLEGDQYALVESVRALIRSQISPITEEVKYGGILFSSEVQFCGVFAYKRHVSVEFGSGAKISDPFGYLEGGGKGRRHVKLLTATDIETKNLASYVTLALEAARRGA